MFHFLSTTRQASGRSETIEGMGTQQNGLKAGRERNPGVFRWGIQGKGTLPTLNGETVTESALGRLI